ncbi:hypothetical protein V8E55_010461, partial [Tylopilus felleus]
MKHLEIALNLLHTSQMTMSELITELLSNHQCCDHAIVQDLLANALQVLTAFQLHPATSHAVEHFALSIAEDCYQQELHDLASEDSGWHFGVSNATIGQLESFSVDTMAQRMEERTSRWWGLLGTLLGHDTA